MHKQIQTSPDTTAENMRAVVDVLAEAGINIEAIAPDFECPHIRVLVRHNHPYDPDDPDDAYNAAFAALQAAGLEPTQVRSVELIQVPNAPAALQTAMDALEGQDQVIDSILVLPGGADNSALISFGVEGGPPDEAWAVRSEELREIVQAAIDGLA